jgi:hypothetical protein
VPKFLFIGTEDLTAVVMKMEGTCSSETSVDFQRPTRRCIPEDRTLRFFRVLFISFMVYSPALSIALATQIPIIGR